MTICCHDLGSAEKKSRTDKLWLAWCSNLIDTDSNGTITILSTMWPNLDHGHNIKTENAAWNSNDNQTQIGYLLTIVYILYLLSRQAWHDQNTPTHLPKQQTYRDLFFFFRIYEWQGWHYSELYLTTLYM